jgi:hypothetical protein
LTGAVAAGRGAVLTNRPLTARTAFDRTRIEGDLPPGWEAELYRNGELLGFSKSNGAHRYAFDDVQLLYGENRVRVVLYGPQGQVQEREELINVGQENVPKGKTWYWIGANQPGRDLITLEKPPGTNLRATAQASIAVDHGLDTRTSVGVLARAMLVDDRRLTFVEGTVRRSIAGATLEVSAARESNGGTAARAQLLGKIRGVYVNAEALIANDFHLRGETAESVREGRLSFDTPLKIGRSTLPVHAEVHAIERSDGSRALDAAGRLSANFDRFNLASELRYRKNFGSSGSDSPSELRLSMIGSGHIGGIRIRGQTEFDIKPQARFRSAEVSAHWSQSERSDWEGGIGYDRFEHRARARVTHILRLNTIGLALTGEAATDGSVAAGFNLNFSLDARNGLTLSRRPLAQGGMVRATVFRDMNDNGLRDPGEPLEKGALVTTGTMQVERKTDARGSVVVGGLAPYMPLPVGIDTTSLEDPMLAPKKAVQVVVPRPGVPAEVQIALVGGGDVEGALIKNVELGFEGVDLELIGGGGKAIATARTDFDGFFLFQRVPYGSYELRVSAESAAAAKIPSDLNIKLKVSGERPLVRLGAIRPPAAARLANADARPAGAP